MRQLILLRHAKAVSPDRADDDFERELSPRGREDAPLVAAALAAEGASPDIVLVSDAKRTRETWELAQPSFPAVRATLLHSLYLCTAETLLSEAVNSGAENVMLVGHNPGMHELASRLAYRNTPLDTKLRAKFPTAAGAIFTRKDDASSWRLQTFVTPKTVSD